MEQINQAATDAANDASHHSSQEMTSSHVINLKPDNIDLLQIHHSDITKTEVPEEHSTPDLKTSKFNYKLINQLNVNVCTLTSLPSFVQTSSMIRQLDT